MRGVHISGSPDLKVFNTRDSPLPIRELHSTMSVNPPAAAPAFKMAGRHDSSQFPPGGRCDPVLL